MSSSGSDPSTPQQTLDGSRRASTKTDPTSGRGYCRCEFGRDWEVDYRPDPPTGICRTCDRRLPPADLRHSIAIALRGIGDHEAALRRWGRHEIQRRWLADVTE